MTKEKRTMPKRRLFRFLSLSCAIVTALLFESCLNPINFSADNLPTLKVEVSGSIKIDDVAVMWLINRSNTLDVTDFTISRAKAPSETDAQYAYPMNYTNKPLHGNSVASYHTPTDIPFTVSISWRDTSKSGADSEGEIAPFEIQLPRADDYKYYLYRTVNGDVVAVTDDKIKDLPPDPDDTVPSDVGVPTIDNAHTLVVVNLSSDQDIDEVAFVKDSYTYVIANEPRANDQQKILLGEGSYKTKASYTRDGSQRETVEKTAIVTAETASMASKTNFLYFYKTTAGDYQLTQSWSPIPGDASEESQKVAEEQKVNVDVDVNVNLTKDDVAVMWLINRSKTLDVTGFTINREKLGNETDEQYVYPMNYTGKPLHGNSLASYHALTDKPFTLRISWRDTSGSGTTGEIDLSEVYFPRATDYKFYLYRTTDGDVVAGTDDKIKELPPDPDDTVPSEPPIPPIVSAHTLVVLNVTPDQNIDEVEFVKESYTYAIANEPRAKDQQMILLEAGSYAAKASYTRGGSQRTTSVKTAIVTAEAASMALRTNFLYFYKTTAGDYQLTQNWPPIPNDASDGNRVEDALLDTQGILEIVNNAVANNPHALIARINIGGTEYPNNTNTTNYMGPGDPPKRYVLPVGPVHVSFRPTDQTFYGQTSIREIESKKITTLSYINDLGNPFTFPEDTGNGSGLIRIVNNSTGVAISAAVYDKDNPLDSLSIGYEDFNPPLPVQYGKVGLVPVVGTAEVPLRPGANQLVQVLLETVNGIVVVERVVALKDQIVTIEIIEINLEDNQRAGSRVTVANNTSTPTTILGLYVYNGANPDTTTLYSLNVSAPPGGTQSLYVLSTTGMPIVQGVDYRARLTVYGNGNIGIIEKNFEPDGLLYSLKPDTHTRTITLNQFDLPPELAGDFKPVTGITVAPSPYPVNSTTESDLDGGNKTLKNGGTVNLNNTVTISPADASKRSPVKWSVAGGASNKVSLSADGLLTVTGIADPGNDTVRVKATIENAAGTLVAKTDFEAEIEIRLTYQNTIRTVKVGSITLAAPTVETGRILDLTSLATLNPSGANINGVPITPADIIWTIASDTGSTGSMINGSTFTAGTAGSVTIQATLPADKNGGTPVTQTAAIIIQNTLPDNHKNISSVTLVNSPQYVPFYTKNILDGAQKKRIVYDSTGVHLSGNLQFNPPDATRQSPMNWSIVSGSAAEKVFFRGSSSELVVKRSNTPENPGEPALAAGTLPINGEQLRVKVTIPDANYNTGPGQYEAYVSGELAVSLREFYSNNVVDLSTDFRLDSASLVVPQSVDLKTLAHLPADATRYVNGSMEYITANDLTWQIVSGSGAQLSGSSLTATAAGTVTIRATLPANKNQGVQLVREQTITITEPPPPPPPSNFTLRIVKMNGTTDSVSRIVLVAKRSNTYSEAIYRTGHTKEGWVPGAGKLGLSTLTEFKKVYPESGNPDVQYINVTKIYKENDWVDVTIPWPTGNVTGYYVFFIEGDNRVRGYVNPPTFDPDRDKNFLFFLRPDYLYDNLRMWMNGYKQAAPNSAGSLYVIPIGYDSYYNTASIMKPNKVGERPTHDLSDY
jgi:hypothetical protein